MKKWKTVFQFLRCSWRPLFAFELLYKLLAVTVFTPLTSLSLRGIMELSGYSYLTVDNVGPFLLNPVTLLMLALLLLILAFYVVFDISAILFAVDLGRVGKKTTVAEMVPAAWRAAVRVFRPRNWPLAVAAVLLLPFLNIGIVSGFVSTVAIPEAILEYLMDHWMVLLLAVGVGALLSALLLRWLYVFHYYALERCPFREARRRSAALGRGSHLRDLLAVVLLQAGFALVFLLAVLLLIALAVLLARLFATAHLLDMILTSVVWTALSVLLLVFTVLSVPMGFCCISALYYLHKMEKGEAMEPLHPQQLHSRPRAGVLHLVEAAVVVVSLACCSVYVYRISTGEANINIEYVRTTEVTAHRGASRLYPENTMPAFEAAVELGADWIELDIQQTRDGQIVVMHDTNLRRTTGLNRYVWELDYAEISGLDAGSWFSSTFSGTGIPLLSEVMEFAKEHDIRLNIELKPTGHETDFEKSVVELVRSYDMTEDCVLTSQSYDTLQNLKAWGPDCKTVYVMAVAFGNLTKLDAADAFSIKSVNVTESLVSRLHDAQKEIYAWTVNSRSAIEKMIRLQVDNVITNDVVLAKECVYSSKTSNVIQKYLDFLSEF